VSAVYLYDDARARTFEPFALTRPIGELRAGALLVRERWARALGAPVSGHVTAAVLNDFEEAGSAPVLDDFTIPAGSWIANARFAPALAAAPRGDLLHADGHVAAVRVERDVSSDALAGGALALDSFSLRPDAPAQLDGWWMDGVWDYVRHLVAMLDADIPILGASMRRGLPRGAIGLGEHPVFVAEGAVAEPSVCFDTTAGPILLCAGSRVLAFTRLVGPLYVGEHSILTTDRISASSIGDTCKVHGELSTTIMTGHSNKGHDGFVGHSMMGRWVNLGAGTITSNLKNTYGPVQLWTPEGLRDSGLQFLGTFFGDHAKAGIGTRLTTGCVLGAGANVFGSELMPKVVAPFSWGETGDFETYRVDKFLESVERMMARRDVTLGAKLRAQLERAHERRWSAES
jgi:UDP-N-acetylglucosamine diphosphorylase / glucose-1-phosphate thymidylyltransferase / UDP-N-acetylgalactosamine diphosphorylase / glucosamine-1-phosphate N-acetyltransferase / galactosamine-1-phosphate N-acetyltransferase